MTFPAMKLEEQVVDSARPERQTPDLSGESDVEPKEPLRLKPVASFTSEDTPLLDSGPELDLAPETPRTVAKKNLEFSLRPDSIAAFNVVPNGHGIPDAAGSRDLATLPARPRGTDAARTSNKKPQLLAPAKAPTTGQPNVDTDTQASNNPPAGRIYNEAIYSRISNLVQHGDIVNVNYLPLHNSLFSVFALEDVDISDSRAELYRASRQQHELAALIANLPSARYQPYASVEHSDARQSLRKIAEIFQFLDNGFAEYFRMSVPNSDWVSHQLGAIRNAICSRQQPGRTWVGSLGDFCEEIIQSSNRQSVRFESKDRGSEKLKYLQDALEVPYWHLIAQIFINRSEHDGGHKSSIQVARSVVKDMRREIQLRKQTLEEEYPGQIHADIIGGINARLHVLDRFLEETPNPFDTPMLKQKPATLHYSGPYVITSIVPYVRDITEPQLLFQSEPDPTGLTDLEKVSSFTLLVLFLSASFIPAAMGFSGYYKAGSSSKDAMGSVSDPDFYWLISDTLMATLGNLYSIIPLLKLTRGSEIYWVSWGFWFFSIIMGVASIATYAFINKCWSSTFSSSCTLFAITSVFASTLATARKASMKANPVDNSKRKTE